MFRVRKPHTKIYIHGNDVRILRHADSVCARKLWIKVTVTEVAIDVFWKITVSESLQLSKNNREVAHFNKVLEKEPSKPLRKY